uniref:Uncharacterized protein n=1 Tax=Anopheles coluzzii TaxID=1518534 RepID=A0A8W7PEM4_ANOCL
MTAIGHFYKYKAPPFLDTCQTISHQFLHHHERFCTRYEIIIAQCGPPLATVTIQSLVGCCCCCCCWLELSIIILSMRCHNSQPPAPAVTPSSVLVAGSFAFAVSTPILTAAALVAAFRNSAPFEAESEDGGDGERDGAGERSAPLPLPTTGTNWAGVLV